MREAYETARVHLVALACEIAVLVALIDQELARISEEPGVEEIRQSCREHRSAADQLLGAESSVEAPSLEVLWSAIDGFRTRLADVRRLWQCLADTHQAKAPRRSHSPRTSQRPHHWF